MWQIWSLISRLPYFIKSLISREHLPHLNLYKENICRLFNRQNVFLKVFCKLRSNNIIKKKIFEHASLIFTKLWALANEIDFLKNEFWADRGVDLKLHFQNCK